jgi:hypothetical protein
VNKILKKYSFEGKDYILVRGFDIEAYEVKPIDMELFKSIENHVKEMKAKEVLFTLAEKVNNLSIEDLAEIDYFLSEK